MCISYPGEIVALDGATALVRTDGALRRATTLALPDAAVGDRVLVAAGSVVVRLDPAEADEVDRLVRIAYVPPADEGAP
jgi:hydrogenase maturation factor